jgi:hypothetical protein
MLNGLVVNVQLFNAMTIARLSATIFYVVVKPVYLIYRNSQLHSGKFVSVCMKVNLLQHLVHAAADTY